MNYAKLTDDKLAYAPCPIRVGGTDIFTTDPTPYGYKAVVYPDPPAQEGFCAVPDGWEEAETELRQKWRAEPLPPPPAAEEDYAEELARLGVTL